MTLEQGGQVLVEFPQEIAAELHRVIDPEMDPLAHTLVLNECPVSSNPYNSTLATTSPVDVVKM